MIHHTTTSPKKSIVPIQSKSKYESDNYVSVEEFRTVAKQRIRKLLSNNGIDK